jgi:hypothetical protein
MEGYFKKISNILKSFSLTERERTNIRLHLAALVDEYPATAPLRVRAGGRISEALASRHTLFGSRSVAAALVLVMVVGVTTSYAAETALPGDPLYAVKVNINEPVERATVAASQSSTQWDVTLTSRRLEEAEKLAASGTLTPSKAAIVQTQLTADTQSFDANVAALATSTTDAAQVADAQSDLEAALSAHVQVLVDIASSTPSVQGQVAPILATVRTHVAQARGARIAALATLDESATSTSIRIAASSEKENAVSGLASVRMLASKMIAKSASSTAQIDTAASDTQQAIDTGDSNLAAGHFKEAFSAFQSAARTATQVQVGVQAQSNLGGVTLPTDVTSNDDNSATSSDATATSSAQISQNDATSTAGDASTSIGK